MSHNAAKVLLGAIRSSFKVVDNKVGTVAAGLIARLKSDGTVTTAAADGLPLGISLGKDLSDAGRMNICRSGLGVPLILTAAFTPTVGAQVHISDTTGKGIASGAGATGMNAVYASGVLTGVKEDGTTDNVALIDFQGGL